MYFDTHAHYDDERFDEDRDAVLSSMAGGGVELVLNAACSLATSRSSIALAEKYPFVYASVGVHPHDAKEMNDGSCEYLKGLSAHPKVVAIGEIGLDYHYDLSPRDVQQRRFHEQLELAKEVALPVIIHEREACRDVLDIIRQHPGVRGVYHCYSGSWETAKEILAMGWNLSFTGVVTFKNARKSLEVVKNMPADRLMIETDSPYLAPEPVRGRRNTSLNLVYIAARIAEARGMAPEELAHLALDNGKRFFGIA
ncbi:MAG: TatD family hydrolase [Oscillospiraceae bacterium]|nr:TatD family hydrolase [Oscillospiraceae bacterium]